MDLSAFEGHTPGPWMANADTTCSNPLYRGVLAFLGNFEDAVHGHVSVIVDDDDRAWRVRDADRATADARLMAAAPDLLAEVQALRAERDQARAQVGRLATTTQRYIAAMAARKQHVAGCTACSAVRTCAKEWELTEAEHIAWDVLRWELDAVQDCARDLREALGEGGSAG